MAVLLPVAQCPKGTFPSCSHFLVFVGACAALSCKRRWDYNLQLEQAAVFPLQIAWDTNELLFFRDPPLTSSQVKCQQIHLNPVIFFLR